MRLLIALVWMGACAANAAELPSRSTKSGATTPEKARKCELDGVEGVLLANGTCIRLSGAITVGVQGGNLK